MSDVDKIERHKLATASFESLFESAEGFHDSEISCFIFDHATKFAVLMLSKIEFEDTATHETYHAESSAVMCFTGVSDFETDVQLENLIKYSVYRLVIEEETVTLLSTYGTTKFKFCGPTSFVQMNWFLE